MARTVILDPTAAPPDVNSDPGPDVGELRAKRVGIRYDHAWRSFEWVIDEWMPLLRDEGADVITWVAGNRVGDEGERTFAELAEFATSIDCAIVGLGN